MECEGGEKLCVGACVGLAIARWIGAEGGDCVWWCRGER